MVNSDKKQSMDHKIDDTDPINQANANGSENASSSGTSVLGMDSVPRESNDRIGLMERLTDILVNEVDGDLLLQRSDREDNVFRWFQDLDMHVLGACRADERLKPLLKLNVSSGALEDHLLAQLSLHFEPSEVGMLARCLCVPLASIRAGKINKQGSLLLPTSTRGTLNLMLLPSSDVRISFIGDDGCIERVVTLSSDSHWSSIAIEVILADKSGRSFLVKVPEDKNFYFWCAEKSMSVGHELLDKMKEFLQTKPSLSDLTGISKSRLDCFAICLQAYLVQSSVANIRASSLLSAFPSSDVLSDSPKLYHSLQPLSASSRISRSRRYNGQSLLPNALHQGSLSPRSNSFKECVCRNLLSLRSIAREKFQRRGDNHVLFVDNLSVASASITDPSICGDADKVASGSHLSPLSWCLESLEQSADLPFLSLVSQGTTTSSRPFSPYYCWCPPVPSTLQYTIVPQQVSILTGALPSPALQPLQSNPASSKLLTSKPQVTSAGASSLDFPPSLSNPLERPLMSLTTSNENPTFTPLTCDSIIHIPVIGICCSGQGHLVNAGPAISNNVSPLHLKPVNPSFVETDSAVEKGAKETLRHLISNSYHSIPQFDKLPFIMSDSVDDDNDNYERLPTAEGRGPFFGFCDGDASANDNVAVDLGSPFNNSAAGSVVEACIGQSDPDGNLETLGGFCGSGLGDLGYLERNTK